MIFICYEKCTTCQKALKWLKEHGFDPEIRAIKEENPTPKELKKWIPLSGKAPKAFFNTSGMLYRSMQLSKRLPEMPEEEQIRLLASDGMLVKRPLLITEDRVLVGFKEKEYETLLP